MVHRESVRCDKHVGQTNDPAETRCGPPARTDPASVIPPVFPRADKGRICQLGENSMSGYRGSRPLRIACAVKKVPTGSKPNLDQARCTLALWVCVEMTS